MNPPEHRPKLTLDAPVGSIELAAEQDDGTPYEIWPCSECLPWHAEVFREGDLIGVREWHAVECPTFIELLAAADADN